MDPVPVVTESAGVSRRVSPAQVFIALLVLATVALVVVTALGRVGAEW